MLKFNASAFSQTISMLSYMIALLHDVEEPATSKWKPGDIVPATGTAIDQLRKLKESAGEIEARYTLMAIERVLTSLAKGECTYKDLLSRLRVINGRIHDELSTTSVFVVGSDLAKYLDDSVAPFGDDVAVKFPSAAYDIVEATKCFGLRRSTASVTHLMRALEVGLAVVGAQFGVNTDYKNWQNVIDEIESKVRAINSTSHGAGWKGDQEFFAGAASHFRMLKDGWRNHAMHVRAKYTEEEAEDIYRSTRAFMRHLSSRLSE